MATSYRPLREDGLEDPNFHPSGQIRDHNKTFEEKKRESEQARKTVTRSRGRQLGPEGIQQLVSVGLQALGYGLEECLATVRRGRLSAEEQPLHDALARAVALARTRASAEQVAEAIGVSKDTVERLEKHGRALGREEQRAKDDAWHAGCQKHERYADGCPFCERAAEERGYVPPWQEEEELLRWREARADDEPADS